MYHHRVQHGITDRGISSSTVTTCPPTHTNKILKPLILLRNDSVLLVYYVDRTHRLLELKFSSSPINFHCVYSRYDRAYIYTTHILCTVTICDYKSLDSQAVILLISRDVASKLPNQLLLFFFFFSC